MGKMLRFALSVLSIMLSVSAFAQSGGIYGTVFEPGGNEPAIGAVVEVFQGGIKKGGAVTDYDGNYLVKPLDPGAYDVHINLGLAFKKEVISGVQVYVNNDQKLNVTLEKVEHVITEFEVKATRWKKPLIDDKQVITSEEIYRLPTRNVQDMVGLQTNAYQARSGAGLSLNGSRVGDVVYIVDGQIRRGSSGINLPQNTVEQMQVFTSGIPAMYGDATGGFVTITTKGVSKEYTGSLMYERSIEGFGHNLLNGSISGPLFSKKTETDKKPIAGFVLGIDLLNDKDNDPNYIPNYYMKEDVLKQLQERPLTQVQSTTGTVVNQYASEFVTIDDMETSKYRRNANNKRGSANLKLDFALSDLAKLTLGGQFSMTDARAYSRGYSLFAPDQQPKSTNYIGSGYIRYTQRFNESANDSNSVISNAYYTIQADYQKEYGFTQHPQHKKNIFDYNYVGKMTQETTPVYMTSTDSASGVTGIRLISYDAPTQVTFEPSDKNPINANYTKQVYEFLGGQVFGDITGMRGVFGLLNGDVPGAAYSLFNNVGSSYGGYSYSESDQVAVDLSGSFDINGNGGKSRHAIQFGLYYQQRTQRAYSLAATTGRYNSLWQLMRLNTNAHIGLDNSNPIFLNNGIRYSLDDVLSGRYSPTAYDTIIYDRTVVGNQTNFDKNLREKLGVSATERIQVDALDPSLLSVDMFSADELFNSGNSFVSYYGYDYLGNKLTGQTSFNDFWTKKDDKGNYTREMGAFRPNYIAGYIQDNFKFKDMEFRVGVRIDRLDLNTKVLKDPYSLYEVVKAGDANSGQYNSLNGGQHPGTIGSDYTVYVNSNESASPMVIGYRKGDDWYDPYGNAIQDPELLKDYGGGTDPRPFLTQQGKTLITDSSYYVDGSFTDYTPQVNVMPRITFRFPIAESALFFAHYDVLVRRPSEGFLATQYDYMFLAQNSGTTIGNTNLKPEKMFDYEVGFQQKLTNNTAITLTGFYKERKDQIQLRPYLYAYPVSYYSYDNRDFSTSKGLTLKYDYRRVKFLEFQINYTLQFAEGSGSSASSSGNFIRNLIAAGLPNLRFAAPMNYDSRHNINAVVDFRLRDNEGPLVGDKHIFQNAGISFTGRLRSGEPYTKYSDVINPTVQGGVMGSRLPWHYMFDVKIDKSFFFTFGGNKKDAEGNVVKNANARPLFINAYVMINNIFNTKDIMGVYGYTSRPDDNGYLTSAIGQQFLNTIYSPETYMDLYRINVNNPGFYNLPRRINVGISLGF